MRHREPETPFEIPETRVLEGAGASALAVHGSTPVHIRELSDKERSMDLKPGDTRRPLYEVRMGFALFGSCNNTEEEFKAVGYNPFHPDFNDNYSTGRGNTVEEALADLAKEIRDVGESLWH